MYSLIVFLLTFLQLCVIGGSYAMQVAPLFNALVVYGSPFHLAMTMLGPDSVVHAKSPLFIGLAVFHVVKYFLFLKAQRNDDSNKKLSFAIVFEAAYLALSAYYLL